MPQLIKQYFLYFLLVPVLLVGLFLRFYGLDLVPPAFYHDEMDHVITGQAILHYGTDLSGTWTPFSLSPLQTINWMAEITPVFHAVFALFFGPSVYSNRLPNTIFGLITCILTSYLGYLLTQKKSVFLLTFIIQLLNPWHIHISRLGYEATISLFFQLSFIILYLKKIQSANSSKYIYPLMFLSLFVSYYTYHGAKFTLLAILTCTIFYAIYLKKKFLSLFLISSSVLLVGHSLYISSLGLFGVREEENFLNLKQATSSLADMRNLTLPYSFSRYFLNNYSQTFIELGKRYLWVFDTFRLFVTGYEGTHQFSLIVSGYFYFIDFIGLLLFVSAKKTKFFKLLLLILFVSPVATVIAGYQALLRSSLTYNLLLLFTAIGWSKLKILKINNNKLTIIIVCVYALFAIWFGLNYFTRYPIVAADNHYLSERLVARLLKNVTTPVFISVDNIPFSLSRSLIHYNNLYKYLDDNTRIQFQAPLKPTYHVANITISTECPPVDTDQMLLLTPNKFATCAHSSENITSLASPADNGVYFFILNNQSCGSFGGQNFIRLSQLNSFNLEKLSDFEFCAAWLKHETI